MRNVPFATVLALAAAFSTGCLGDGHSVNAYAGKRSFDANDWDEVDEPTTYGVDGVLKLDRPWLAVEGGWFHSDESSSTFPEELTVDDYFVGLRITPWKILIEPYGSAGLTYVDSTVETPFGEEGETDLTYYLRLGAAFTIGFLRMGLDARALLGSDVEFDDDGTGSTNLDHYQLAAFLGVGF